MTTHRRISIAHYGEHSAVMNIDSLRLSSGFLPRRALVMVLEWAMMHRDELTEDWRLAETHNPLNPIDPLE